MIDAGVATVFGLLIGSFLNVCIYRLPRDLSVVRPRSHCVSCQKMISWYDNIPLLSYVLLGGKCRACGAAISLRYPIVELLTAALFFVYVLQLGAGAPAVKFCVLGALMVGLIFADLEERILPDEFTLGGLLAAIVFSWFVPVDDVSARVLLWLAGVEWGPRVTSLAEAVVGAIVPAAFLWFGGWLFEKLRHKEGLGLGDVKMLAMAGAFLGLRGALLTLILGSVLGSVLGYAYIWLTHKDASTYQLPFGTFLGTGAIAVTLIGQPILGWYGGL